MAVVLPIPTSVSHEKGFSTSISWSHVSDGLPLYVFTGAWQRTITGVTFNGDALSLVDEDTSDNLRTSIWKLDTPDVATANIVISHGGAGEGLSGVGMNIANISAEGDTSFAKGTSTTPSVTVTSDTDSIVVGALVYHSAAFHEPTMTPPNFMVNTFLGIGDANVKADSSYRVGEASAALSWASASKEWAMIAVSLTGTTVTPGSGGGSYAFA